MQNTKDWDEKTSQSYKEHEKTTVDLFSSLMNPAGAISFSGGQVGITIAEATYDKTRHDSDVTSQTGSAIVANQGVNLAAVGDLTVAGSQVVADNDQDEDGDLNISAENVVVKESTSHRRDQNDELHGKAEVSLVVQHQAVQTANAVKALSASKKALNQARQDYKKYKNQLVSLKNTLASLKADLAAQKPGVSQEDIDELAGLISDLKSDESWYVASIAMAVEDVASKSTALVQQSASAGQSSATLGFDAGLHLDIDVTKTSSDSQQSTSQGSLLSGNNVHIQAGNETGQSATVQGSAIAAKHDLSLSGHEVNLLASTDQSESASQSKS
ncbi:hemagglutinin repeat-containing protein, partial [Vibrio quintilis]